MSPRRRDARQNEEGDAAEDANNEGGNDDGGAGANRERRPEEEEEEEEERSGGERPVITVRVTQDAETGRRTFNIRGQIQQKFFWLELWLDGYFRHIIERIKVET